MNCNKCKSSKEFYKNNYQCKNCTRLNQRIYDEKNKEKKKEYRLKNKDKYNEYMKQYHSLRRKNDMNYKLIWNLRTRLRISIKQNNKSGSAIKDLGCSIEELKVHLQTQFKEDMTWENYGKWHIDHIIPLSSFNLLNREELLKACHYTNLQPLWAKDNLNKSNKSPI